MLMSDTTEDTAVAGKWRALAKSQIRFSSSAWTQALTSSIQSVVSFLGLTYTQPREVLAQDVQPLLVSIRAVREAIGEGIVSKELEVAVVPAGTPFSPKWMKDNAVSRTDPSGSVNSRRSLSVNGPAAVGAVPVGAATTLSRTSTTRPEPEKVVGTCSLGLRDGKVMMALPQVLREVSLKELLGTLS